MLVHKPAGLLLRLGTGFSGRSVTPTVPLDPSKGPEPPGPMTLGFKGKPILTVWFDVKSACMHARQIYPYRFFSYQLC